MNKSVARSQLQQLRILIVEDNVVNQRVLSGMLNHIGDFALELAHDGQQGVERYIAMAGHFDLILMDCEMPVLSGVDASRQIRQYEQQSGLAATPIIIITAHVADENREKCLAAGVDDFAGKPLSYERVYAMMTRFCPHHVPPRDPG